MGINDQFFRCGRLAGSAGLAASIAGEGSFLHAAMNPGFFERLEGGSLGVGQPRFSVALGESPASTAASPYEQEFNLGTMNAVADGSDLMASAQSAKMGETNEFCRRLRDRAHNSRVHDGGGVWIESKLVRGYSANISRVDSSGPKTQSQSFQNESSCCNKCTDVVDSVPRFPKLSEVSGGASTLQVMSWLFRGTVTALSKPPELRGGASHVTQPSIGPSAVAESLYILALPGR